jgi:hypothetical protein
VKPAVGGALALSLLAGGVALIGAGRPGPPPPVPDAVRPAEKPSGRKVPKVTELVWTTNGPPNEWAVLADTNQLKVYTESTALLQLGEASGESWEFSATLKQIGAVGRAGLFLGHRRNKDTGMAEFELIRLTVFRGDLLIQRMVETYRFDAPFAGTQPHTCQSAPLKARPGENTLRLVVRDGRLSEVRVNGEVVPNLTNGRPRPPAAGGFGVYNQNSDGVYSNAQFNGLPIQLLAEAP